MSCEAHCASLICSYETYCWSAVSSSLEKLLPKESKPWKEITEKDLTVYLGGCFLTGTFPSLLPAEEVSRAWGNHHILHNTLEVQVQKHYLQCYCFASLCALSWAWEPLTLKLPCIFPQVYYHFLTTQEKLIDWVWIIKEPLNVNPNMHHVLRPASMRKLPYTRWDPREVYSEEIMICGNNSSIRGQEIFHQKSKRSSSWNIFLLHLCRAVFAKCFIAIMKNLHYMGKSHGISLLENLIIKTETI